MHASQAFALIRVLCSVTLLVIAAGLPRHGRLVLRPLDNEGVRHPVDLGAEDLALIAALVSLRHPWANWAESPSGIQAKHQPPPATGTAHALAATVGRAVSRCLVTHPRPPAGVVV